MVAEMVGLGAKMASQTLLAAADTSSLLLGATMGVWQQSSQCTVDTVGAEEN